MRISKCRVIGGPKGRVEFVSPYPVALAAAAVAAVLRYWGGRPPPAVHPGTYYYGNLREKNTPLLHQHAARSLCARSLGAFAACLWDLTTAR